MRILVTAALESELQGELEKAGAEVLYAGVGKINAAYRLAVRLTEARIQQRPYDLVLNFGTAGSARFKAHTVVECSTFLQRDMDVRPLGLALGETPFDSIVGEIRVDRFFPELPEARCGTGDNFSVAEAALSCDVVDMEAYAFAKVCRLEGVAFCSVKYITDGSDSNAHTDWAANLPRAAKAFAELYKSSFKP